MTEGTQITALMPLKNHYLPYLRKAIQSLKNQSSPRWKLLVIVEPDDFESFRYLLNKDLEDPRIKMIRNQARKLSGAFNTGMRHAETDFVAILLSDDVWSENAVETLETYIHKFPEADFLHSSRRIIDETDNPISSIHYAKENFGIEDFLDSSPVKHLLCWRVEKALSFGGMDESLNCVGPDDYDFPWTMAESGGIFVAIPECLYLYRDHRESYRLTTHLPLSVHEKELRRILKKHGASPAAINKKIADARSTYLRQCLYKSKFDKWIQATRIARSQQIYRERYK